MKTERIPFDFSLWGQEGIEVWHEDGRKAVYVGETDDKAFPFIVHWHNKSVTWFNVDSQIIYMTRQVKQKTLEEVVSTIATSCFKSGIHWDEVSDETREFYLNFSRILLEKAKEEGLI